MTLQTTQWSGLRWDDDGVRLSRMYIVHAAWIHETLTHAHTYTHDTFRQILRVQSASGFNTIRHDCLVGRRRFYYYIFCMQQKNEKLKLVRLVFCSHSPDPLPSSPTASIIGSFSFYSHFCFAWMICQRWTAFSASINYCHNNVHALLEYVRYVSECITNSSDLSSNRFDADDRDVVESNDGFGDGDIANCCKITQCIVWVRVCAGWVGSHSQHTQTTTNNKKCGLFAFDFSSCVFSIFIFIPDSVWRCLFYFFLLLLFLLSFILVLLLLYWPYR